MLQVKSDVGLNPVLTKLFFNLLSEKRCVYKKYGISFFTLLYFLPRTYSHAKVVN